MAFGSCTSWGCCANVAHPNHQEAKGADLGALPGVPAKLQPPQKLNMKFSSGRTLQNRAEIRCCALNFKHLALYLSKLVQPGVQVSCVDQPGDQRPSLLWLACHKPPMSFLCHFTVSLLWIPAPVVDPGFIGPNGSRNDANGPWQVLFSNHAL